MTEDEAFAFWKAFIVLCILGFLLMVVEGHL